MFKRSVMQEITKSIQEKGEKADPRLEVVEREEGTSSTKLMQELKLRYASTRRKSNLQQIIEKTL